MICPKCQAEIEYVGVLSECYQKGFLSDVHDEKAGTCTVTITSYSSPEILESNFIECPECFKGLSEYVKEG